jgi:hypothetical protein
MAQKVSLASLAAAFPSFLPTLTKFILDAVGFEDDVLIDIIQTSITEVSKYYPPKWKGWWRIVEDCGGLWRMLQDTGGC